MPEAPPLNAFLTFRYGPDEAQQGDLYLPASPRPPVACLLHCGFWRMPHGREQFAAVAGDLRRRGFAAWNIGYRRLGAPGGGWPGTLRDVAVAVDHLATLADGGIELDLDRIILVGHSAGGQLALWAAARDRRADVPLPARVRPVGVAALAAVADLAGAHTLGAGNDAVAEFLGGSVERYPERLAAASPMALLPLGTRQFVVHGGEDDALPVELYRRYASAALAAGDCVDFAELPGAGHMDYLDPGSEAHALLCGWLDGLR